MTIWSENSKKNLLPLSEEKTNFSKAVREWTFTGEIVDHELATEICELCEHDNLRYHFEIMNALQNQLWVGSKCIEKFDIIVFDENGKEVKSGKEEYLKKQARKKHIKNAFDKLKQSNSTEKIRGYRKTGLDRKCILHYEIWEEFDPKILNYMFLRFDEENIFYDKKAFKIRVQSHDSKMKLLELNKVQFDRIKGALNTNQRNYYLGNKK